MFTPQLAALVLAAGGGTRLGGGKLNLLWQEKSLAAHVLLLVQKADCFAPLACVVGHEAATTASQLAAAGLHGSWQNTPVKNNASPFWHMLTNPAWAQGQSTSLRTGIHWLAHQAQESPLTGVMVFLGDQPLIHPETIRLLVQEHHAARCGPKRALATVPVFQGKRGNPVILDKELFPALASVTGDSGARGLFQNLGPRLNRVPVEDPGVCFDVDTPEDYAYLLQKGLPSA